MSGLRRIPLRLVNAMSWPTAILPTVPSCGRRTGNDKTPPPRLPPLLSAAELATLIRDPALAARWVDPRRTAAVLADLTPAVVPRTERRVPDTHNKRVIVR